MADVYSDILTNTCNIDRMNTTQSAIGGTTYSNTSPTIVFTSIPCSIQSLNPKDVEDFVRRGISVSHKVYTSTDVTTARLGDRVVDARYSPTRYYVVKFVEDMAGRGEMFAVFCDLIR